MTTISRRLRESELRRQARSLRVREALKDRLPRLLPEYFETLAGALVGFLIVAFLLAYFAGVNPVYTLSVFGFVYSLQAGYYRYRLSVDPTFTVPRCACAGRREDGTEAVLRSRESAILRVPNAVLGTVLYPALFAFAYVGLETPAVPLVLLAVVGSAYLGYVMVARIGAVCSICVNVAALNVLLLWQLAL